MMPVHPDRTRGTSPRCTTRPQQSRLTKAAHLSYCLCQYTSRHGLTGGAEVAATLEGATMARRTRPRRITVDLSDEMYEWLLAQQALDRITTSDRVRSLIALAQDDESLRTRVDTRASELAATDRRRPKRGEAET